MIIEEVDLPMIMAGIELVKEYAIKNQDYLKYEPDAWYSLEQIERFEKKYSYFLETK